MVIFLDITKVLSGNTLGLTRGTLRTTGKVRLAYGPSLDPFSRCLVLQNYGLFHYLPRNKLDLKSTRSLLIISGVCGIFPMVLDLPARF